MEDMDLQKTFNHHHSRRTFCREISGPKKMKSEKQNEKDESPERGSEREGERKRETEVRSQPKNNLKVKKIECDGAY